MKHSSDTLSPRSGAPLVVPPRQLVPITSSDRGPATFFHGREQEITAFQKVKVDACASNGGTIFLIQDAPGAGKSALLHECARRAAEDGWRVAEITNDALYDPVALADAVDVPYATKSTVHREAGWRVGLSSAVALFRRGAEGMSSEYAGRALRKVLEAAATPNGLVLVLDEVQTLGKAVGTPHDLTLTQTLEQIHNGKVGAPVILLAGGLGISRSVLGKFGISRFGRRRVMRLGRLSGRAERDVIRDWLVNAGGACGDSEYLERWIDTIAAECCGWPQHIQNYAAAAAQWLLDTGGVLTAQAPTEALAEGRDARVEYYDGRVEDLDRADRVALARLLRRAGDGCALDTSELIAAFSSSGAPEVAPDVLRRALHKGVVVQRRDGRFEIPIPSMHTWLVQEYADPARPLPPMSRAEEGPAPAQQRIAPRRSDNRDRDPGLGR